MEEKEMESKDAIKGLSLNEILATTKELSNYFHQAHMKVAAPASGWAKNMEQYSLHMKFQVGGWFAKSAEEQGEYSKGLWSTINQGFGIIEVNIWAKWGGNYYDETPIEGTIAEILIVDRRTQWDDGSYTPRSFEEAKAQIQQLLDNPKSAPLLS